MKMNKNTKEFDYIRCAFWLSVISFLALLVIGLFFSAIDVMTNEVVEVPKAIGWIGFVSGWVWVISVFALWISAFLQYFRAQSSRSTELNVILFLFLIFGSFFAAYYFYFERKKTSKE